METSIDNILSEKDRAVLLPKKVVDGIGSTQDFTQEKVLSLVDLTYGLMFPGKKHNVRIEFLSDEEMEKRDRIGIAGYIVKPMTPSTPNRLYLRSSLGLESMMWTVGHELGHFEKWSPNKVFREAAAELFRFYWSDTISNNDVGGLNLHCNADRLNYQKDGTMPFEDPIYREAFVLALSIYEKNKSDYIQGFKDFDSLIRNPLSILSYGGGRVNLAK